jgi:hypothetical protein
MSHQFTYPNVTEIRRVSLEIAGPPIGQGRAGPGRSPSPLRAPLSGHKRPVWRARRADLRPGLGGGQMAG